MKPIECDVFSTCDLRLDGLRTINGNLYVNGDADLVMCENPVEIYGDLIVDGNVYASELIVHGNLICKRLCCDSAEVDEDIFVSAIIDSASVTSNHGNICINDNIFETISIVALEGSITIIGEFRKTSNVTTLKAFHEINITGDVINVSEIVAGYGLYVNGILDFEESDYFHDESISISVYSGGIHSSNININ